VNISDIYAGLAARLGTVYGVEWFARRDLAMEECKGFPAMLVVPGRMVPEREAMLTTWRLEAHVGIVVRVTEDPDAYPYERLLPLVDRVREALRWRHGDGVRDLESAPTTLGGLVYRCWISGEVEILGGGPGESYAAARIPIELLVTEE
jgi:hypothetical protein